MGFLKKGDCSPHSFQLFPKQMENINLYEELGSDCLSIVYKGRRMGTLNYVALKRSEKAKRPEIINHIRLSKDLDHPNIVRFYEWYETRKHLWLVVELCTGGSLESIIIRDECLPEDVVRKFGWDLVKGLEHIHKLQIIFSDLTPENVCTCHHMYQAPSIFIFFCLSLLFIFQLSLIPQILVDSSGLLKLNNFCYSKKVEDTLDYFNTLCLTCEDTGKRKYDPRHQGINIRKRFQGSPTYMAPEVLRGSDNTVNSDLWALGCVLYYMYTGRPPFSSSCYSELKEMILCQEPPSLTQKAFDTVCQGTLPSQDFQCLLECLLSKNPDERMTMPELLKHSFWTPKEKN
ncbi:serine/threonine-protein kinase ULK4-like isoform X1 [Corythoichthys intestinalis]|uniref:serine/threonine-protein kinase ULK4-like isoform X1 n=2 Tax=Corythoichthys intestinalis TaxID=161448 RepID=UPI0025A5B243|nr:serine/threonine-protein kinase ULK4-like isoform X1 [Corythoichthys intestinalis]XP_057689414.1 serine/threonine-protein kinase ULK4-like isoform X1 [Corythoichthys intestinalis]